MNWKRGLFRTWLGFSIVWIAVGFYFTDHSYWRKQISLSEQAVEVGRQSYERAIKSNFDNNSEPLTEIEFNKKWAELISPYLQENYKLRSLQRDYRLLNMVVFAPPLVLGVVGLLVIWIIAGFRGKEMPKEI